MQRCSFREASRESIEDIVCFEWIWHISQWKVIQFLYFHERNARVKMLKLYQFKSSLHYWFSHPVSYQLLVWSPHTKFIENINQMSTSVLVFILSKYLNGCTTKSQVEKNTLQKSWRCFYLPVQIWVKGILSGGILSEYLYTYILGTFSCCLHVQLCINSNIILK